jgi:hypothetical protein
MCNTVVLAFIVVAVAPFIGIRWGFMWVKANHMTLRATASSPASSRVRRTSTPAAPSRNRTRQPKHTPNPLLRAADGEPDVHIDTTVLDILSNVVSNENSLKLPGQFDYRLDMTTN